ncbi:hypothetical protein Patl1_04030 [Pistacia atlantica]|uniref:Uncharacterized protein n=1 Tax=Pistacia atlantica TaxID=434234 RepID=A0ACC1BUP7_9ROSI|nr:hypothetical protein Patl1_04030 [Pistacia atlantica]
MAIPSSPLASQKNVSESSKSDVLRQSLKHSEHLRSSFQSSKMPPDLQVAFSFEHLTLKPCPEVDKANASVQTLPEERPSGISLFNEEGSSQVTRDGAEPIKREELENICKEQAAKIEQLNRLVEQYKHGHESNALCVGALEEASHEDLLMKDDKCDIKEVQEVSDHQEKNTSFDENFSQVQQENEKLKKQIEKVKRKHKMEMNTMKQYLAESRLPESALQSLYRDDSDEAVHSSAIPDYDDQAWRAEFGAIYQEHY